MVWTGVIMFSAVGFRADTNEGFIWKPFHTVAPDQYMPVLTGLVPYHVRVFTLTRIKGNLFVPIDWNTRADWQRPHKENVIYMCDDGLLMLLWRLNCVYAHGWARDVREIQTEDKRIKKYSSNKSLINRNTRAGWQRTHEVNVIYMCNDRLLMPLWRLNYLLSFNRNCECTCLSKRRTWNPKRKLLH